MTTNLDGFFLPLNSNIIVHKAIEMHNSTRKQDGIYREVTTCRLSLDMPLLSTQLCLSIIHILLVAVAGIRYSE